MELTQLLTALPTYKIVTPPGYCTEVEVTQITADSRHVTAGSLFVAYPGVVVDGHEYIDAALQQGAAVIISERVPLTPRVACHIQVPSGRAALAYLMAAWYNFPARQLGMVGITGTDGKTTTTNFLYEIMRATRKKIGMISTVNAIIGNEVSDTGLHTTTPDAPDVQRYLQQMVQNETEICLLEVTSHGLAHHRVTACDFDIAIITNITHEHLDAHGGSLAAYWAAKAMLFESLDKAYLKSYPKLAVLNCDDDSFAYLKPKLNAANTSWVGYSLTNHSEATIVATEIQYTAHKTRFTVQTPTTSFPIETHLLGDYNVSNCLAAITAAYVGFSIAPKTVQQGVAALSGIPGRMEQIEAGQPFIAMVDFAHTPNSLRRSLQVARTLVPGRVIAVFGCAGKRDVEKRVLMGQAAAELADITIVTAEDPRTENLADIIAATVEPMLAAGAIEGETVERIPDRGQALYRAVQLAEPDDIVLALGKGHEQSMCFGTTEYLWDDRQALRAALQNQPLTTLPTAKN